MTPKELQARIAALDVALASFTAKIDKIGKETRSLIAAHPSAAPGAYVFTRAGSVAWTGR